MVREGTEKASKEWVRNTLLSFSISPATPASNQINRFNSGFLFDISRFFHFLIRTNHI